MDIKITFLNDFIVEEIYVEQLLGFENEKYIDRVYKIEKVLYSLKQVPRL